MESLIAYTYLRTEKSKSIRMMHNISDKTGFKRMKKAASCVSLYGNNTILTYTANKSNKDTHNFCWIFLVVLHLRICLRRLYTTSGALRSLAAAEAVLALCLFFA